MEPTASYSKWLPMWEGRQVHYYLQFIEPELIARSVTQISLLDSLVGGGIMPSASQSYHYVNHIFHVVRQSLENEHNIEEDFLQLLMDSINGAHNYLLNRQDQMNGSSGNTFVTSHSLALQMDFPLYDYESRLFAAVYRKRDELQLNEQRTLYLLGMALLQQLNLHYFPELVCGVVVHLDERADKDAMSGYTLSPYTGTIFTDYTTNLIRYAETIVHESAHSFLNAFLSHHKVELDRTQPTVWSPWRRTNRPLFGIVHGTFAFSIVALFYYRLLQEWDKLDLDPFYKDYCSSRLKYEFDRLDLIKPELQNIIHQINDNHVQQLILNYLPFDFEKQFEVYGAG